MAVTPVIRISEFSISGQSPSGVRHLQLSASGWAKTLGTGAGQLLDFGSINTTNGKQSSATKAIVAMVDDMKDASEAVFNLRFFISDLSDWSNGTFSFNGFPSGQWIQNISLTDASGYLIPTILPSGQNLWRDAGGAFNRNSVAFQEITASGLDSQVTQWLYLSVTADTDVPAGVYGGNTGGFTYRLAYDFR